MTPTAALPRPQKPDVYMRTYYRFLYKGWTPDAARFKAELAERAAMKRSAKCKT